MGTNLAWVVVPGKVSGVDIRASKSPNQCLTWTAILHNTSINEVTFKEPLKFLFSTHWYCHDN